MQDGESGERTCELFERYVERLVRQVGDPNGRHGLRLVLDVEGSTADSHCLRHGRLQDHAGIARKKITRETRPRGWYQVNSSYRVCVQGKER
jgi:hypothetical protein